MRSTLPWALGLVLALAPAVPALQARSADEPAFLLSSGVVKLGGDVTYELRVENARAVRITGVPTVAGLTITQPRGPSRESRSSWINGRVSSLTLLRWTGTIRPLEVGDFEIPPFELEVDGRSVRTRTVPLTVVEDMRGEELGFFDFTPSTTRLWEGQPLTLTLDVGWDASLDVDFANLALPWWGQLPGWIELERPGAALNRRTIELGLNGSDRIVAEAGSETRDGRAFHRLRVERTFLPTRPGSVELPASFLEFRRVVERGRSFFDRDRTERYYVRAPDLALEILPLPEEDRPYDFSGAVGRFDVAASVDRRDVDAGDSIKLTVEWSGEGNFEFFQPPDLERDERFADFRVYGSTESKEPDRRTVVYDLAPLRGGPNGVREIPSVRLPVFDTESGGYAVVETRSIPVRVRALETDGGLAPVEGTARTTRDVRDIAVRVDRRRGPRRPGAGWVLGGLLGVPVLWLGLRAAARRRGDPGAPAERQRRRARRQLARALRRTGGERSAGSASGQLAALDHFLAARTGEPAEAWTGRDARAWAAGQSEGPADSAVDGLAELREELECAAWDDGADRPVDRARVLAVADELLGGGL